ncbi:hypothetical protein ASPCAL02481 [Aspergillus calidoustus]|uniref:DNA2/NAM7 helicase-like C-terminal domain-containing protein n=1 Tax=Aspergillus calidoustus TaxID=454130 RepID=A0A0U5GMT8_ASPCI|nr:hypothetical protein ASPCAL02481 [Aspergillus calidoustus]
MSTKEMVRTAYCTANTYNLPYSDCSLFYLPKANPEQFAQYAVKAGERPRYIRANVIINVPCSGAQREVDAINRLSLPEMSRFVGDFLNQKYQHHSVNDPTACLGVPKDFVQRTIKQTLTIRNWSDSQKRCISGIDNFPGMHLIVEGYPGTGKTSTIVAMASIYVACGGHVLFTAPTHDAADAICETIVKWNAISKNKNKIEFVRVYRMVSETKAFRRHGIVSDEDEDDKPVEEKESSGAKSFANIFSASFSNLFQRCRRAFDLALEEQEDLEEDEHEGSLEETPVQSPVHLVENEHERPEEDALHRALEAFDQHAEDGQLAIAKAYEAFNEPPVEASGGLEWPISNSEARPSKAIAQSNTGYHPDDDAFVPMAISLEDQLAMSGFLKEIKKENSAKGYRMPDHSLEANVFRLAFKKGETLTGRFPTDDQIEDSPKRFWVDAVETGDLIPEGPEVDMLEVLREYAQKLEEGNSRQIDQELASRALLAFKQACRKVIRDSRVVVCTNNTSGDPLVATSFGSCAQGILIIRDEDPKELEPNCWVPVTKLAASARITGIIAAGDPKQLTPTVVSNQGPVGYNEFEQQLCMSFVCRMLKMNHPSIKLTEQFRYRDVFVPWLNHQTYDGLLSSHTSTGSIPVNSGFLSAMRVVTGLHRSATRLDFGNVVISVDNAVCDIEPGTMSRYNDQHRQFIIQLLVENSKQGGYRGSDVTIIAPYMAQVVRMRQDLFQASRDGLLPASQLPKVATVDSMQGKENELVIFDCVISAADSWKDIGFTADQNRGNVAMTRMRQALVVILPEAVGSGAKSEAEGVRYSAYGDRIERKAPYPCALMQFAAKRSIVLRASCPQTSETTSRADLAAGPMDSQENNDEGAGGGSWSAGPTDSQENGDEVTGGGSWSAGPTDNQENGDEGTGGGSWSAGPTDSQENNDEGTGGGSWSAGPADNQENGDEGTGGGSWSAGPTDSEW